MTETLNKTSAARRNVTLNCERHGEYQGFMVSLPNLNYQMKSACPKCLEEKNAKTAELNKRESEHEFKQKIEQAGFPLCFKDARINNLALAKDSNEVMIRNTFTENQKKIDYIVNYVNDFEPTKAKNLYIVGGVDLGKTHTACAAGLSILEKGHSVLYGKTIDILEEHKETVFDREKNSTEWIQRLTKCKLLIMDKFANKNYTQHEKTFLDTLLNARFENMLPTIFISRVGFSDAMEILGEDLARYVEKNVAIIEFTKPSEKKAGGLL